MSSGVLEQDHRNTFLQQSHHQILVLNVLERVRRECCPDCAESTSSCLGYVPYPGRSSGRLSSENGGIRQSNM